MNIISNIISKLKEIFNMRGSKTIETIFSVKPAVSNEMGEAIELWSDMYLNQSPWLKQPTYADPSCVESLGLAQLIASEKARTALIEFKSEITTPIIDRHVNEEAIIKSMNPSGEVFNEKEPLVEDVPKGSTDRANYLDTQYKKLLRNLRRQIEYGIAKGGLVIKPYIRKRNTNTTIREEMANGESNSIQSSGNEYSIEFDYVQADGFFPLAFDTSGNITEAAFLQKKVDKEYIYSRVEHHKYENDMVTITNRAFVTKSTATDLGNSETDLGKEIPLTDVPEWSNLQRVTTINNVDRLLFAYFKMPEANTIDTYSPLGVSGYSRAVGLIKQADVQYSRLLWEFEGSELAIDIDRDALRPTEIIDDSGNKRTISQMSKLQQRLYRPVDLGEANTYQPFSPAIRDISLINGLNTLLMRIEDAVSLSRGTLSDATAEARTATELKILKQRTYSSNKDLQDSIQDTLNDVIYIMNVYCDLYQITADGEYEVSYEWDDSILVDSETELNRRLMLMNNGIVGRVENRMWYFGETEKQAKEAILKVEQEALERAQINLEQQFNLGNFADRVNPNPAKTDAKREKTKDEIEKSKDNSPKDKGDEKEDKTI